MVNYVSEIEDELNFILDEYKVYFENKWKKEEKYKWIAIKHFQDNWNIDADNFSEMFENATAKTKNLLSSSHFYPRVVMIEFAQADNEKVREMFRNLYDESLDLIERVKNFESKSCELFQKIQKEGIKNHYQTPNAISTYLWLKYPNKYTIYKKSLLDNLIDRLCENNNVVKSKYNKMLLSFEIYDKISEYVKTRSDIKEMFYNTCTSECYSDPEFKTMAIDIVYFINKVYYADNGEWYPTESDYDPGITRNQWLKILRNNNLINEAWCMFFYYFYQCPEGISFDEIAEEYGKTVVSLNDTCVAIGKAIQKETNCPLWKPKNFNKYYPIMFLCHDNNNSDEDSFIWRLRDELYEALTEFDIEQYVTKETKQIMMSTVFPKNMILYGPPGTGKTYYTAIYAVAIIEKLPLNEVEKWPYDKVMEKYRDYSQKGQIAFTTFHQSYGYEDFIEGIRPELSDNEENTNTDLNYCMKQGVFQEFCRKASIPALEKAVDYEINASPTIWKVSLEGTGSNATRTECMNNDHIRIGWNEYGENPDLNNLPHIDGWKEGFGKTVLNAFINRMKKGDIVFSCYSAYTIDAIGVITGEPEWDKNEENKYRRIRNVKWLAQNMNYDVTEINGGKSMTLATVYALNNVTVDDVLKILQENNASHIDTKEEQPNYVFIIDEINRGNISKIFGELITLIEPTKRAGKPECVSAILPYSHKSFAVPDNVYIIGTMNTADRSISLIDTALRRRFQFIEMMPDIEVLDALGIGTIKVDNKVLHVSRMLDIMNKRIECLYDREHMIGHAFFTPLKEKPSITMLAEIFRNKVLPLLQEYFFEDYSKIQLVLGDNSKSNDKYKFVCDRSIESSIFKGNPDLDVQEISYEIQEEAFSLIQSYKEIGNDL